MQTTTHDLLKLIDINVYIKLYTQYLFVNILLACMYVNHVPTEIIREHRSLGPELNSCKVSYAC